MQVLRGRKVNLIPDLGATEQWKEKSALLSGICKRVVVSNVLECTSDEEQRSQGLDIADFFLYSPSKRQILHQMIQRNPALQLLIDELDLELAMGGVSADSLTEERTGDQYYLVRVKVSEDGMKKLGNRKLQPGMPADVLINAGERTMLQYLLKPARNMFAESLIEE